MHIPITSQPEYGNLVNFSGNMNLPIHSWFNLKEGYSSKLVSDLMSELKIKEGKVFDPFSGCGTTLLTAKEKGINFLGFEVNPFLYTLTKTKIATYDSSSIHKIYKYKSIIKNRASKVQKVQRVGLSIADKVFGSQLDSILRYRQVILGIRDEKIRNFYLIAFLSVLERCGFAKKDGNGLRYPPRKKPEQFITAFPNKVEQMLDDIVGDQVVDSNNKVVFGDCRNIDSDFLEEHKNSAALSVFSPPYLNCFDYTEIYKVELWFGGFVNAYSDLKNIRNSSLTSHLNKEIVPEKGMQMIQKYITAIRHQDIWSPKIPDMVDSYFSDMQKVLRNVHKVLKKGGHCVIIVGNSAYGRVVIPTDEILAVIGESMGFKCIKLDVARKLNTSPQQQKKITNSEKLRESLVYLQKC